MFDCPEGNVFFGPVGNQNPVGNTMACERGGGGAGSETEQNIEEIAQAFISAGLSSVDIRMIMREIKQASADENVHFKLDAGNRYDFGAIALLWNIQIPKQLDLPSNVTDCFNYTDRLILLIRQGFYESPEVRQSICTALELALKKLVESGDAVHYSNFPPETQEALCRGNIFLPYSDAKTLELMLDYLRDEVRDIIIGRENSDRIISRRNGRFRDGQWFIITGTGSETRNALRKLAEKWYPQKYLIIRRAKVQNLRESGVKVTEEEERKAARRSQEFEQEQIEKAISELLNEALNSRIEEAIEGRPEILTESGRLDLGDYAKVADELEGIDLGQYGLMVEDGVLVVVNIYDTALSLNLWGLDWQKLREEAAGTIEEEVATGPRVRFVASGIYSETTVRLSLQNRVFAVLLSAGVVDNHNVRDGTFSVKVSRGGEGVMSIEFYVSERVEAEVQEIGNRDVDNLEYQEERFEVGLQENMLLVIEDLIRGSNAGSRKFRLQDLRNTMMDVFSLGLSEHEFYNLLLWTLTRDPQLEIGEGQDPTTFKEIGLFESGTFNLIFHFSHDGESLIWYDEVEALLWIEGRLAEFGT